MSSNINHLAKIQTPRLSEVFPRTRLFKKLDEARRRPLIWINAMAGAGKTTLAGSYVHDRNLLCLWYRVDSEEDDLAGFFHYLALAAKQSAQKRYKTLPALTPEYMLGIPAFTRRYFEQLYSQFDQPFVIVLDNYEHIPVDSAIHHIICQAVELLPEIGNLLITSRYQPPPAFTRLRANSTIAEINNVDLQMTRDETQAITVMRKIVLNDDQITQLHQKTHGWVAGQILILETNTTATIDLTTNDSTQLVFDYFAEEIFNSQTPEIRLFLLQVALLPEIAEHNAACLTDNFSAGEILTDLADNLYFTKQFGDEEKIFLFHPLFRAFLLERGEKQFSGKTMAALKKSSADLLQENHPLAAFDLYLDSHQYDEAIRLICQRAPVLLQQGRLQTLQQWISGLPENICKQAPWVLYWQGISLTFQNPLVARQTFEQAYALFIEHGDTIGAMLACSGMIDTFPMLWDNFRQMEPWIDRLAALLNNDIGHIPPEIEYRITNSMLIGYSSLRTGHPDTEKWLARGKQAIQTCPDPFIKTTIFQNCYYLNIWSGNRIDSQLLLENVRSAMTGESSIPMAQIWWYNCECIHYWHDAKTDKANTSAQTALQLAEETGVHVMDILLLFQAAMANLTTGQLDAGRRYIELMQPLIVQGQLLNEVCYYNTAGILAWHEADLSRASTCMEKAVELCNQSGHHFAIALNSVGYALILFEQGQTDNASTLLTKTRILAQSDQLVYVLFQVDLFLAYFSIIQGDRQTARHALTSALAIGRKSRYIAMTWWHPQIMSLLCSEALDADIETDYVCDLIRRRKLTPHPDYSTIQNWPWSIRIHTFGGLRIIIYDEPLSIEGKPQTKPLELLMALIALGATNVERVKLADALWPDADGNDALESFKTTLRRLRQLLQHEHVLPLQDGKLSLNKTICWLDTWVFTDCVNQQANSDAMDDAATQHQLITLIQLYTGAFLGSDGEQSWAAQCCEQLRNNFLQAVLQLGAYHEQKQDRQQAVDCYENALHVEQSAEMLYQRLIVCYHKMGLDAEALNSYNRCETQLKNKYGIPPSAKTLELVRSIKPDL